ETSRVSARWEGQVKFAGSAAGPGCRQGEGNRAMAEHADRFDMIVAGAGYVGLAIATAVAQARPSMAIAVVDAAPAGVWQKDGRSVAVAAAAVRMLDAIGCWQEIEPKAHAMTEMIITDSRAADPVRPVFLTFDGEVEPGE